MEKFIFSPIALHELGELIENSIRKVNSENKPPEKSIDERLTRKELRREYKISFPSIHKHMKLGMPYDKIGRRTMFIRKEVDNYFKQKKG